jgi:hypothetical protein
MPSCNHASTGQRIRLKTGRAHVTFMLDLAANCYAVASIATPKGRRIIRQIIGPERRKT